MLARENIYIWSDLSDTSRAHHSPNCTNFSRFRVNRAYLQVRVAGLVTTLVNVTGGHQGATNALAAEEGAVDTRNGTTPKVRIVTLIISNVNGLRA